jgi:integrase
MAKTIINRLSDRKARTVEPGMYPDGAGLYLRVTLQADGAHSRYWLFRYAHRGTGKDRQLGLGALHTVSLAQARTAARECRELLLAGKDPVETRRTQEATQAATDAKVMTFDQCRDAYVAIHRPGWSSTAHADQWPSSLKTYATPIFGHLPVAAVDTGLVLKALEPHWAAKTETMSRVRGRIEAILDWAKVRGLRDGENPARWRGHLAHMLPSKTKLNKGKVAHHPALPYQQIGEFMTDLRSHSGAAARMLELAILVGGRSNEVLGMQWSEIEWATGIWTVPAERMKGRREHRVPLSEPALVVLRTMQQTQQSSTYVFPGIKPGKSLCDMMLHKLIRRLNDAREKAGLPQWTDPKQSNRTVTAHGFRSAFRDWVSEATIFPDALAEAALAHASGDKVEAAYKRGELLEKRRKLMAAWAKFCGKPSAGHGEVVPLRKGA